MKDLYVFGAGVQGRVVADLVRWQFAGEYRLAGFFDDGKPAGTEIPSAGRVLGGVEDAEHLLPADACVFVALGSRHRAKALQLIRALREGGLVPVRLISPGAHVSPSAETGDNALVMPGALLGAGMRAGDLLWVHGNAAIEHDTRLGCGVLAGPGAAVASGAVVGHGVLLGAGSVLSNSVTVGDGAVVGAGAVVVRDVPPHAVCFGNPARVRRATRAGDEAVSAEDLAVLALPPVERP